jgi:hypothetical protein
MPTQCLNASLQITHISFRNYYCASLIVKQLQVSAGPRCHLWLSWLQNRMFQLTVTGCTCTRPIARTDNKGYWRTVLRKQLMVDPNFEDDAQDQHVLQPQEVGRTVSLSMSHLHLLYANFGTRIKSNLIFSPLQFNDKYDCNHVSALRFYLFQPSPNWRSFGLRDVMCYRFTAAEAKPQSAPTTISGRTSSSGLSSSFSMVRNVLFDLSCKVGSDDACSCSMPALVANRSSTFFLVWAPPSSSHAQDAAISKNIDSVVELLRHSQFPGSS